MLPRPWSAAAVAVLAGTVLTGCGGSGDSGVAVGTVGRGTVTEVVEAPATAQARAAATVSSPATGTVATVAVSDGQRVRRGRVLLTVASPATRQALVSAEQAYATAQSAGVSLGGVDLSAQQTQADAAARAAFRAARSAAQAVPDPTLRRSALASVARAQAQYAAARAQAAAAVQRLNAGVSSLQQSLDALTAAQTAQASAAVRGARSAVAALTVRAPIAGTVVFGVGSGSSSSSGVSGLVGSLPSSLQGAASGLLGGSSSSSAVGPLRVGAPVSAGQTLLTVTDVSSLSLVAEVDETDVLLVRPGVRAAVVFDAVPTATYAATVETVDLNPTTSSRGGVAYVVRLRLGAGRTVSGAAAPRPRPGMSAVAELRVRHAVDAVALPASAVFQDGRRYAVWFDEDGVARKRTVVLGAQGADSVQVLSGVEVGDRVVVRGADRVREGQKLP